MRTLHVAGFLGLGLLAASLARAQNASGERAVQAKVLGTDGGIPRVYLTDTAGQQASIQATSGGLLTTLDEKNLQALTDGCDTGELLHAMMVPDQTVGSSAVEVPLLADAGRPADTQSLVRLVVQNNTVAKDLRCSVDTDGGDPATCSRGLMLTQQGAADFPVRFPERLSCICCSMGGPSTGCTASTTVQVCQ